jgi:ribonuclease HI
MKIDVYTDGACSGNPGPGGWGAMIYYDDVLENELSGGISHTTNNVMELTAPIMALSHLLLKEGIEEDEIIIYSDSSYVVKSITEWAHKWIKTNFKGKANPELMRQLYELSHMTTLNVKYQWVKAHNGNPKNEAVDKLAVRAIVRK